MSLRLDKLDIATLNLLQINNLATAEQLSGTLPLSPSAITRRIRRLRYEGAIERDVSILSPDFFERRLRVLIHVQLRDHGDVPALRKLWSELAASSEVQSCFEVTGGFDLAVIVVTRDVAELNQITETLLVANAAVLRFEMSFIKREIKNVTSLRLGEEDAELRTERLAFSAS